MTSKLSLPTLPAGIKVGPKNSNKNDIKPASPIISLDNLSEDGEIKPVDEEPRNGFKISDQVSNLDSKILKKSSVISKAKAPPSVKTAPPPVKTAPPPVISTSDLDTAEKSWIENASLDMQIRNFKRKNPDFDMIDLPENASLTMKRAYVVEINKLFQASQKSETLLVATNPATTPVATSETLDIERTWLDGVELTMNIAKARKDYPELEIPELPSNATLDMKQDLYAKVLRYISISNKADGYKFWLTVGIGVAEFVVYQYLGVDIRGFLAMQSGRMHKFKGPLWAMAERNSVSTSTPWPPEIQIIFIIMTNAVVFILIKVVSGMIGSAWGEKLGSMLINALDQQSEGSSGDTQTEGVPGVPAKKNMGDLGGMISGLANMFMGGNSNKFFDNNSSTAKPKSSKKKSKPGKRKGRSRPAFSS